LNGIEIKAIAKSVCPILRYDKKEIYTPTNFIELFRKNNGDLEYKCSNPKENWITRVKFDPQTGLYWFAPTIFIHFLQDVKILIRRKMISVPLIIQYFYYYAYNTLFFGLLKIPYPFSHPHDWETIQIALDKNNELVSYSISSHGTFLGICSKSELSLYQTEGFPVTRGGHNFGSILQMPNQPHKTDIIITPATLVPISTDKYGPMKETLVFLDDYKSEFLKQFSFFPVLPPWEKDIYDRSKWNPEFWSWPVIDRLKQIYKEKLI
jgi:hypothetical protein